MWLQKENRGKEHYATWHGVRFYIICKIEPFGTEFGISLFVVDLWGARCNRIGAFFSFFFADLVGTYGYG